MCACPVVLHIKIKESVRHLFCIFHKSKSLKDEKEINWEGPSLQKAFLPLLQQLGSLCPYDDHRQSSRPCKVYNCV